MIIHPIKNLLQDIKIDGLLISGGDYKKPDLGVLIELVAGFAFKLIPDKTKVFKLDPEMGTRNPGTVKMLEQDPLLNQDKIYAGNLKRM